MTNIPKKLTVNPLGTDIYAGNVAVVNKINQLIDYLESKQTTHVCNCCKEDVNKASKGECHKLLGLECDICGCRWIRTPEEAGAGLKEYCPICVTNHDKKFNPPESKGECSEIPCTHCTYGNPSCQICHKNPPEHEEEWNRLNDLIHDAIYGGVVRGVDVIQYVNDNFVSKEKIKNIRVDERKRIIEEAKGLLGYKCGRKDCDAQLKTLIFILENQKAGLGD